MELFVASLFAGVSLGGIYALIAIGLVLAFRATRTFNFAHGELMLLPAFIVAYAELRGSSPAYSIPVALAVSAVIGALFYVLVLRRIPSGDLFMAIIATFGLAAVLDGVMGIGFPAGQYSLTLPAMPNGGIVIAGARVPISSLVIAGITLALAIIIILVLRLSQLGLQIRAAGEDPILASQCGIRVRLIYRGSWAAAAVLAGIAGITYGSTAVVSTDMVSVGLVALPAIVLGGLDSIEGALVGSIVVGMVQAFTQIYIGGQYVYVVTYALLLVILLLYPQGLFGTREVVRA